MPQAAAIRGLPSTSELPADPSTDFRLKCTTLLAIINTSGQLAASLTLKWMDKGIPVGDRLVACSGADGNPLRQPAQLDRPPPRRGAGPCSADF